MSFYRNEVKTQKKTKEWKKKRKTIHSKRLLVKLKHFAFCFSQQISSHLVKDLFVSEDGTMPLASFTSYPVGRITKINDPSFSLFFFYLFSFFYQIFFFARTPTCNTVGGCNSLISPTFSISKETLSFSSFL